MASLIKHGTEEKTVGLHLLNLQKCFFELISFLIVSLKAYAKVESHRSPLGQAPLLLENVRPGKKLGLQ